MLSNWLFPSVLHELLDFSNKALAKIQHEPCE